MPLRDLLCTALPLQTAKPSHLVTTETREGMYLVGEGAVDAEEEKHHEELREGQANARVGEGVFLVVAASVPEAVVVAGLLHQPAAQEEHVDDDHGDGFQQPHPGHDGFVLREEGTGGRVITGGRAL